MCIERTTASDLGRDAGTFRNGNNVDFIIHIMEVPFNCQEDMRRTRVVTYYFVLSHFITGIRSGFHRYTVIVLLFI